MTRSIKQAHAALEQANAAISGAAFLLASVQPTLEQFVAESRQMESLGPVVDPTLFMDPERQVTEALLKPVYVAALNFSKTYKAQLVAATEALAKVKAHG